MILYTVQPEIIYKQILENGIFTCNELKSFASDSEKIKNAYDWIVEKMDKKIEHPENIVYPIWGWYKRNNNLEYPDINELSNEFRSKTKQYLLELEIPDDQVLLSDYNKWEAVLNDAYFHYEEKDEDWDIEDERYKNLSPEEKIKVKVESWDQIFDVDDAPFVQATFWAINRNMIKSVQEIKNAREIVYFAEKLKDGETIQNVYNDKYIDINNINELNERLNNFIINSKNTYMHRFNIKDEFDLLDKKILNFKDQQIIDLINLKINECNIEKKVR